MTRHVVYSGVRLTLYEVLRREAGARRGRGEVGLADRVGMGMFCGAVGQFCASPADLIKVQLQTEGKRRLQGEAPRFSGAWDALRTVVRVGGAAALWKGAVPNVQRAALVNLGDLTTYDQVKTALVNDAGWDTGHWTTHLAASVCSGLAAAMAGTPADVVKTRMMNQPVGERWYRGATDCLVKTVSQEGVMSLYKGFLPCWLRMAPWSLTFWLTFEKLRTLTRVGSW